VATTNQNRIIALSGPDFRNDSSPVRQLITWVPGHGRAKIGSLTTVHINTLMKETVVENGSRKLYEISDPMGSVSFQLPPRRQPKVTEQEVTKL